MRIGLLTSDLTYHHGWGNYSLSVIKSLQKQGHKLTILTASNSQSVDGIEAYPILPDVTPPASMTLTKMLFLRGKANKLLADCDVIHSTVEIYAPLVQLIAQKRPIFMTAHGSYINLPAIRRFPVNLVYRNAYKKSHIICVSHYTESIANVIVPGAKTSVILNAINTEKFSSIEHCPTENPIVVSSGGIKARKGTLQLLGAIAKVRDELATVECHILGSMNAEPTYVELVKSEIEQLNLQETVFLHGFVNDEELRDWYAKADVFALPSINSGWKFEGFGLATLEASASGIAVIGTRDCGAEDAIDHEKTGLLVSQENIDEELPLALLDLLTNREKAREMGIAGRMKAQSHTWNDVATQLVRLYESELKR